MSVLNRKNIPVSQQKKDECNARAQQIVLNLIDGTEDESVLFEQLRWINQNHYQDVVEERSIMKLCGYPLCCQKLGTIPKKKYHISVKQNKVYDITERKMFCSNNCYKASSYLKEQIFTSPLWFRDPEDIPKFTLLNSKTGLLGEEIDFCIERVQTSKRSPSRENETEKKRTHTDDNSRLLQLKCSPPDEMKKMQDGHQIETRSVDDFHESQHLDSIEKAHIYNEKVDFSNSTFAAALNMTGSDDSKLNSGINSIPGKSPSHDFKIDYIHLKITEKLPQIDEGTAAKQPDNCINNSDIKLTNKSTNSLINVQVTEKKTENSLDTTYHQTPVEPIGIQKDVQLNQLDKTSKISKNKKLVKPSKELVLRVEKCLREWLTIESLCHILGNEPVTQMMREKGKTFSFNDSIKSDPLMYERYTAICKKLKILEIQEDQDEKETIGFETPTKPLPDYTALKEQTKEMEIKVRSFYRGDLKVSFAEDKLKNNDTETTLNTLPLLHQHAKSTIRRNIVLEKLKIVLPDLCEVMGFHYFDIYKKVKELLLTCRFSAHNITFKPLEWNLISLVLLKLLSVKDNILQCGLRTKSNYINTMLMSYQLENNYLELLCTWLTEIDHLLKNENSEVDV